MLHQICKAGYFGVNLVDSKDSKLLLELAENLIQNKASVSLNDSLSFLH